MNPLSSAVFSDPIGPRRRLVEVCDQDRGQPIALRGFNLSGAAKNFGYPFSPGLARDIIARAAEFLPGLAADGFDLLRIPLVWEHLQPEPDGPLTAIGPALRALCAYAGQLGFRVLLDVHQDVLSSYFRSTLPGGGENHGEGLPPWVLERACAPSPLVPPSWVDHPEPAVVHQWALNYEFNQAERAAMRGLGKDGVVAAFRQFAARLAANFAGLDNVVAYEVLNEPYSKAFDAKSHAALACAVRQGLGDAVRPGATPTWSVMPAGDWLDGPGFICPEIDTHVDSIAGRTCLPRGPLAPYFGDGLWLVTPHFYDPRAEPLPSFRPQADRYERVVQAADALFDAWNAIPIVGEFGCDARIDRRDACHRRWLDLFEARGWSWCLWNFNPDATRGGNDHWCGEHFSVAEQEADGTVVRTPSYYALLRPFPRRYGAPVFSIQWDGRTYRALMGAPYRQGWRTDVFVPASLGAFDASGPCSVQGRIVRVDHGSGPAEIIITFTHAAPAPAPSD